jgi:hypothetical protein
MARDPIVYLDQTYTPKGDYDDSCIIVLENVEAGEEAGALAEAVREDEQVQRGECSSKPSDWVRRS